MKTTGPADTEISQTSWLRRIFSRQPAKSPQPETSPPAAKHPLKQPAKNQRVLVVDDDPLFLKIASTQLEWEGYEVITAQDGCEAIEAFRKQKPNMVLLDLHFPQDVTGVPWDGFRIIAWLKRTEALKNTPVVMMTSSDPSKYAREAVRAGAAGFFHKRTDAMHMLTLVHQALNRRAMQPANAAPGFSI